MRSDVTIFGNHKSTTALIDSLIRDGLAPDLVVTLAPAARERVAIASGDHGLAARCRDRGIRVHECAGYRLTAESDRTFFAENTFGIGICTDWQQLIPAHVLDVFEDGIFGFHGSLMAFPNGRGRSPFNWSIRLGGKSVLHNCFRYTEGADDGGVFNTTEIPVGSDEPIAVLQFKALMDSRITIRRLLQTYKNGNIDLVPQPEGASVWLPKLTPEDSHLQFQSMGIEAMIDIVRASSRPFAGAYAIGRKGTEVRIWRASLYDGPCDPQWEGAPFGTVLAAALGSALIACRGGLMLATEVSVDPDSLCGEQFQ